MQRKGQNVVCKLMKKISTLQFITASSDPEQHLLQLKRLCQAGVDWIQLRLKNANPVTRRRIAQRAKLITKQFSTRLILNDYVALAKEIGVDGVHLGQNDMPISKARIILGDNSIIGGTANTWPDMVSLQRAGADYIGLGPLRFTSTKRNLNPILGLEGYQTLMDKMKTQQIAIPVLAIGGVTKDDLTPLKKMGVHGVAISSYLLKMDRSAQKKAVSFIQQLFSNVSA